MPTNLALDDRLIEQARTIGHHKTKKEAVTAALDEYIRRRKQVEILDPSEPSTSIRTTTTKRCGSSTGSRSMNIETIVDTWYGRFPFGVGTKPDECPRARNARRA